MQSVSKEGYVLRGVGGEWPLRANQTSHPLLSEEASALRCGPTGYPDTLTVVTQRHGDWALQYSLLTERGANKMLTTAAVFSE